MLFILGLFLLPIFSFGQDGPVVNTPLGSMKGTLRNSWRGTQFYSFRGVRYAEPPTGELRFKVSPELPSSAWLITNIKTITAPCSKKTMGRCV